MVKDLSCTKINYVIPLYLFINKINGYIEESNGNKYFTFGPYDESKDALKNCEELCNKVLSS